MGAAIMSYSALNYVKSKLPECELHVLCLSTNKESWELLGLVSAQNIHGVEAKSPLRFLFSLLGTLGGLRRDRFDLVVDFDKFTRLSAIVSFLVGARQIASFYRYEYEGLYRGHLIDIPCAFNQNAHIAKNFLALCKSALGKEQHYPNYKGVIRSSEILLPPFKSDPDLARQMKERVKVIFPDWREGPLVLVNPDVGPNLPIRNYPIGHYVQVISGILERSAEARVLLIGMPENAAVSEKIVAAVRSDPVNTAADTRRAFQIRFRLFRVEVEQGGQIKTLHRRPAVGPRINADDAVLVAGHCEKCIRQCHCRRGIAHAAVNGRFGNFGCGAVGGPRPSDQQSSGEEQVLFHICLTASATKGSLQIKLPASMRTTKLFNV